MTESYRLCERSNDPCVRVVGKTVERRLEIMGGCAADEGLLAVAGIKVGKAECPVYVAKEHEIACIEDALEYAGPQLGGEK